MEEPITPKMANSMKRYVYFISLLRISAANNIPNEFELDHHAKKYAL